MFVGGERRSARVLLSTDRPLAWVGRHGPARAQPAAPQRRAAAATCRSGCCASATGCWPRSGPRWKRALLATVGRWTFDYLTLLAALAAIGSHPRPGLVLLAFCGAQVLAQIPVTPGGLGFVEAGLTRDARAGRASARATRVLATFAYRLFSYWLPLPLGPGRASR